MAENFEIPSFLVRMKKITEDLGLHYVKREKLSKRVKDATLFFNRDLSEQERQDGLKLLKNIMTDISETDLIIRDLQTEYALLLESKAINLVCRVTLDGKIDASGESLPERSFLVAPWTEIAKADGESIETITTEDIWVLKLMQKIFGVDASDIEIFKD